MDVLHFVLAGLLVASLFGHVIVWRKHEVEKAALQNRIDRLEDSDAYKGMVAELVSGMQEARTFEELGELLQVLLPSLHVPPVWKVEVQAQGSPYFTAASPSFLELERTVAATAFREHRLEVGEESVTFHLLGEPPENSILFEVIGSGVCSGAAKIRSAFVDGLTGLWSREYLVLRLREEIQRAHRHRHWVSLVMVDSDHFKEINDTYGHAAGDLVIKEIAGLLRRLHHRGSDVVARFGGDEFLVLLPETRPEKAALDAERIRKDLSKLALSVGGASLHLTCSVGVYSVLPGNVETDVDRMLSRVDAAMYEAKANGRNCVVAYKDGFSRGK